MRKFGAAPSRCSLCRIEGEFINHMLINFPYLTKMWKYISLVTSVHVIWEGGEINEALQSWLNYSAFLAYRALPVLFILGGQLARNKRFSRIYLFLHIFM